MALQIIITIFLIVSITFFIAHLIPGSPFFSFGKTPSSIVTDNISSNVGLNENIFVQYWEFLKNLFCFDLGSSLIYSGVSVYKIVFNAVFSSVQIGFFSVIFSILSVVLMTMATGKLRKYRVVNSIIGIIGTTIPTFVFAVLFQWLICVVLKITTPFWDHSFVSSLPAICSLSIYPTAYLTSILSNSIDDEMSKLYCKLFLLRGKSNGQVLLKNALPNALPSIIGAAIPLFINTLMGSFVVEKFFAINGLGWYFISSITNRDYPLVLGLTFFYSAFFVCVTVIADTWLNFYVKKFNSSNGVEH